MEKSKSKKSFKASGKNLIQTEHTKIKAGGSAKTKAIPSDVVKR